MTAMRILVSAAINLAMLSLFESCQRSDGPAPFPLAQAADYAIYSAIINSECRYQQPDQTLYLIDNQTIKPGPSFIKYISGSSRQDSISTNPAWQQFIDTVDSSQFEIRSLRNSFATTCYQIQLLTTEQRTPNAVKSLLGISKELANVSAVLYFSSVIYSPDGTKAVCYRTVYCGFDCAWGSAYLVERKPAGWKIMKSVAIWTS